MDQLKYFKCPHCKLSTSVKFKYTTQNANTNDSSLPFDIPQFTKCIKCGEKIDKYYIMINVFERRIF